MYRFCWVKSYKISEAFWEDRESCNHLSFEHFLPFFFCSPCLSNKSNFNKVPLHLACHLGKNIKMEAANTALCMPCPCTVPFPHVPTAGMNALKSLCARTFANK